MYDCRYSRLCQSYQFLHARFTTTGSMKIAKGLVGWSTLFGSIVRILRITLSWNGYRANLWTLRIASFVKLTYSWIKDAVHRIVECGALALMQQFCNRKETYIHTRVFHPQNWGFLMENELFAHNDGYCEVQPLEQQALFCAKKY